jgi:hypothetical protein
MLQAGFLAKETLLAARGGHSEGTKVIALGGFIMPQGITFSSLPASPFVVVTFPSHPLFHLSRPTTLLFMSILRVLS